MLDLSNNMNLHNEIRKMNKRTGVKKIRDLAIKIQKMKRKCKIKTKNSSFRRNFNTQTINLRKCSVIDNRDIETYRRKVKKQKKRNKNRSYFLGNS